MAVVQSYFDPGQPIVGGSAFTQALDLFMQSTRRQNELFLKYNQMPPEQLMERLDQINTQISNLQDEKISQYELMEKTSDYAQKLKLKRESQQYAAINKERKAKFKAAESAADYQKRQNEAIDRRMEDLLKEKSVEKIGERLADVTKDDTFRNLDAEGLKVKINKKQTNKDTVRKAVEHVYGSDDKISGTAKIDGLQDVEIEDFANAYIDHFGLFESKSSQGIQKIKEDAKKVTAENRSRGKTGKVKMVRPAYSADVDTDIESIYLEALEMMAPETAAATARNEAIQSQIDLLDERRTELLDQLDPDAGVLIDPLQKFEEKTGGRSTGLLTANVGQAPLRRARRGPTLPEVSLQDRSITVPRPQIEFDPRPVEVPFPEFRRKDRGQEPSTTVDEDIADLVQVEKPPSEEPPPTVEESPPAVEVEESPPAVQQQRGVARNFAESDLITTSVVTTDGERREDVSKAGDDLSDGNQQQRFDGQFPAASFEDQVRGTREAFKEIVKEGEEFEVISTPDLAVYRLKRVGDDLEFVTVNGQPSSMPPLRIGAPGTDIFLARHLNNLMASGSLNLKSQTPPQQSDSEKMSTADAPPEAEIPKSEQRYFVRKEADQSSGLGFPTVTVGDTTKPERQQVLEQLTPTTNFEQGVIESFKVQPKTYQKSTSGRRGKVLKDFGSSRIVRRGTDEFEKYQKQYEEAGGQSEQQFREYVDRIKEMRKSPMSEEQLIENLSEDWMKEAVRDTKKFSAVYEINNQIHGIKLGIDPETRKLVAYAHPSGSKDFPIKYSEGDRHYEEMLEAVKVAMEQTQ